MLNALLQDLIHFLDFRFLNFVSVDHPNTNFTKMIQNLINLKIKYYAKTGTTEESIANAEKIGFKTNLQAINPLDENKIVPVYFG